MTYDHPITHRYAESLMLQADPSAVVPLPYDILWSLLGLLWLLIPIAIAVSERRRGASWVETFLWFAIAFLIPALGLIIWAIYRIVGKKPRSRGGLR